MTAINTKNYDINNLPELKKLFIDMKTDYFDLNDQQYKVILDVLNLDIKDNLRFKLLELISIVRVANDLHRLYEEWKGCRNDLSADIKKRLDSANFHTEATINLIESLLIGDLK